jgi:hypothetical protein
MSVHSMFPSRAATQLPARIIQSERKIEASRPHKVTRQECKAPTERATAEMGGKRTSRCDQSTAER